MPTNRLGRTLAAGVAVVAVFNTLASVSMPVPERRHGMTQIALLAELLFAHAALYWGGERARSRFGMAAYIGAQAAVVFTFSLGGSLLPVGVALYVALTAETVVIAAQRWGTVPITFGAIALFAISAIATSNLYGGATAGLLLAVTGVITHAIAALVQRRSAAGHVAPISASTAASLVEIPRVQSPGGHASGAKRDVAALTPREHEVLIAVSSGARTTEIASQLGISERTVKAHLASIYQKLAVESRTAAIAAARQRDLL